MDAIQADRMSEIVDHRSLTGRQFTNNLGSPDAAPWLEALARKARGESEKANKRAVPGRPGDLCALSA